MEENNSDHIYEDIKFPLKTNGLLKSSLHIEQTSAVAENACSEFYLNGKNSSTLLADEDHTENDAESSILEDDEYYNSMISAVELELKERELQLYNDLQIIETEEKKAELNRANHYEKLCAEVEKLRQSNDEKDAKISELTSQNVNLKKNICSLYKTAKSEIEQKNLLLSEANRKLDNLLFRKYSRFEKGKKDSTLCDDKNSYSREERTPCADNWKSRKRHFSPSPTCNERNESNSRRRMDDQFSKDDTVCYKRRNRRSECSPEDNTNYSTINEKGRTSRYEAAGDHNSNFLEKRDSKREKLTVPTKDLVEHSDDLLATNNISELNKSSNQNASTIPKGQAIEVASWCETEVQNLKDMFKATQRDFTETNAVFFNLLPEDLRQSFEEYEVKQITSLNKLKQTFVNCYFTNSENFDSLCSDFSEQRSQFSGTFDMSERYSNLSPESAFRILFQGKMNSLAEKAVFNNIVEGVNHDISDSFAAFYGYSVNCNNGNIDVPYHEKFPHNKGKHPIKRKNSFKTEKEEEYSDIPKSVKKDIIKLYSYRNEKLPFLMKRKFGLLKSVKSEKLL